jgi:hypothetical protein
MTHLAMTDAGSGWPFLVNAAWQLELASAGAAITYQVFVRAVPGSDALGPRDLPGVCALGPVEALRERELTRRATR